MVCSFQEGQDTRDQGESDARDKVEGEENPRFETPGTPREINRTGGPHS